MYKQPLATRCHCLPGRGHVRRDFRVSVRSYWLCLPNSYQGASGAHYCHPSVAERLGVWRMSCFTAQLEKELSDCSFEFLNTPGSMGGRPVVLCPRRSPLRGQGGEGRTGEGRGGIRRSRSWRPWGPASARTFQKLMLAGRNFNFGQNPITPYRTPRVDLGIQCQM